MDDDRPTTLHPDAEEDAEDAVPDWSQFAAFKRKNADVESFTGGARSTLVPFIPKRGEKDFEPLAASSSFPPESTEATLSTHQQHLLQSSRNALYTALSSGSRHHSSRAHNSFTWRPELGRASCDSEDGLTAHGIHFGNVGHFHTQRRRLELIPEEALYMCERGGIELWKEFEEEVDGEVVRKRVPMSVQQAWAECIGAYDLTPERYQVYAYLRRLGYVITRARPIPGTSRPVYLPPPPSFYLRFLSILTHPAYFVRDALIRLYREGRLAISSLVLGTEKTLKKIKWSETRKLGKNEGRWESLVAGGRWTSYDQIFSRLQLIPTCALHTPSRPLRAPIPRTPSVSTPIASSSTTEEGQLSFEEYPYQVFYHVYKPVTKYKKNNPPEPDFRLLIVNAATTPVPSLYDYTSLFSTLPLPATYSEDLDPLYHRPGNGPSSRTPRPATQAKPSSTPAQPEPESGPSSSSSSSSALLQHLAASLPHRLASLLPASFLPPPPPPPPSGPTSGRRPPPQKKKTPSPYPVLKTGRRSVLLAVVDNGTSSILRLSEGEFGKLAWVGGRRRE
ncbi:hypothetical protein JCM11641_000847 [Rhodosporidiobolus odoratus]